MARYLMVKLKENIFNEDLEDIIEEIQSIKEVQDIFLYNKAEEISPAWDGATEEDVVREDRIRKEREYLNNIKKEIKLMEGQASHLQKGQGMKIRADTNDENQVPNEGDIFIVTRVKKVAAFWDVELEKKE